MPLENALDCDEKALGMIREKIRDVLKMARRFSYYVIKQVQEKSFHQALRMCY